MLNSLFTLMAKVMSQADDEWGGEYTVINGEEKIALWIPMSLKEKQALMAKAVSENVKVSELVANYLKSWIKGA